MTEQLAEAWAPIVKTSKNADGTLYVYGKVSDDALDRDKQKCDTAWLGRAVPEWFAEGGNIREQHSRIAAGKAVEHEIKADGGHYLKALVVDPVSVLKVETNVLTGFSVGIKQPRVVLDKSAPGGRIIDGKIVEVSLVDRPCNPGCTLTIVKADSTGAPELAEQTFTEHMPSPGRLADAIDHLTRAAQALKGDDPERPTMPDEFLTKADAAEFATKADVASAVTDATTALTETVVTKTDAAEFLTKTDLATAVAEAIKTAVPDLTGEALTDAVTKAVEPLTTALAAAEERLAKVEALPTPGGPVLARTAEQAAAADSQDKNLVKAEHADLVRKADEARTSGNRLLAQGYEDKAAALAARL